MKLLLLSNSTNPGEPYLHYSLPYIKRFLKNSFDNAIFIPFAGVTISYDEYAKRVSNVFASLNCKINSIHKTRDYKKAIESSNLIIVGGGNTFQLIKLLQDNDLIHLIQQKVKGNTPYIGWSAGANVVCPTICTTNDMPIVQPESFVALNLIPFQINPHYTDKHIPGHRGETRYARIKEYIELNADQYVVGLREGTLLEITDSNITLYGNKEARIFKKGSESYEVNSSADLSFLFSS